MLDPERLRTAVALQKRAYRFVKWFYIPVVRSGEMSARIALTHSEAALPLTAWLKEQSAGFPEDCQPLGRSDADIRSFANMLGSYFQASFDLVENPGQRGAGGDYCDACGAHLVAASHLRTKKLSRHDKEKAQALKISCLRRLAQSVGGELSEQVAEGLAVSSELRESIAMLAYGEQLLLRMEGHGAGPTVLALWREFAWTETGAPKKDFNLDPDDILRSQEAVLRAIKEPPK